MKRPSRRMKWVENEVIFRQRNKKAIKRLASTKAIAEEEGETDAIQDIDNTALLFYCECADEKCRRRIKLSPKEYLERHKNNSQFILLPGHEIPEIERVVSDSDSFVVVEKFINPPSHVKKLNPT